MDTKLFNDMVRGLVEKGTYEGERDGGYIYRYRDGARYMVRCVTVRGEELPVTIRNISTGSVFSVPTIP